MQRGSIIDPGRGGRIQDLAHQASADAGPPEPWRELSPDERKIWDKITATKANSEWTGIDIYLAVEVCHCLTKIAYFDEVLDAHDYLQFEGTPNERPHPYINVVTRMWDRLLRLQTKLGIALTTEVVGHEQKAGGRRAQQVAEALHNAVDNDADQLIPRPSPSAVPTPPHSRSNFKPLNG